MSENYPRIIQELLYQESSENYEWELSPSILSRRKDEIYRDTGVSKNLFLVNCRLDYSKTSTTAVNRAELFYYKKNIWIHYVEH